MHTFQLIRMKFCCGEEAIQVERPDAAFELAVVLLSASNDFNVGMHSGVYEPI